MKNVIITGASRGIGAACARRFADAGWNVLAGYCSHAERAGELAEKAGTSGGRIVPFFCDVREPASIRRFVAKAIYEFGGIDAAILNAGVSHDVPLFSETEEGFDGVMAVNAKGVYFSAQAAAKEMTAGGSIVTVSSMWGVAGAAGESAYSASKAAVIGMTKAFAGELATAHIRVNAIAPGVIDTEMNACYGREAMDDLKARTPLGRLGTPEDVASLAFFLCSEEASFITGQIIGCDGGFLL